MPAAVLSRKALSSLATLVLGTAAGCGSGLPFDDYTITEGPLSGKIGGAPWTVAWGGVQSSLSTPTDFFAVLHDASGSCDAPPSSDRSLIVSIPRQTGEYELDFQQTVTFVDGDANKVAVTGRIEVESVGAAGVSVGLYAIHNADENDRVSGHFTADVCP